MELIKNKANSITQELLLSEHSANDTLLETALRKELDADIERVKQVSQNIPEYVILGSTLLKGDEGPIPTLVDPIFMKKGLIGLVGTSDAGKSAFLRQLAMSICAGSDFCGFKTRPEHHSVIYLSSEDDEYSLRSLMKKQNSELGISEEALSNLRFIFDTQDHVSKIESELRRMPADMVIIDAFADLFEKNLNQNNEVRSFLERYNQLAKTHDCLFVVLHHTGKRTEDLVPSKHNVIGSQGFEAKMRLIAELRPDKGSPGLRHLCIVKANYLSPDFKQKSYVLSFSDNLVFSNTDNRVDFEELAAKKGDQENLLEKIKSIKKQNKNKKISQKEIGKQIGLSQSQVSRLMSKL